MKRYWLLIACLFFLNLNALDNLSCLILLDHHDSENITLTNRFYVMSRLQSAIAEQASPILVHAAIWNGFIERRISFEQKAQLEDTREHKILDLYHKIQERIDSLSNDYNSTSNDIVQNKALVVQRINEEFYSAKDKMNISDHEYQLLLNYLTRFDPTEWSIYRKNGFYLLIPKQYVAQHEITGFKVNGLEKITNSEDVVYNHFESQNTSSFVNALSDFFLTYDDFSNKTMPYVWNIVLSGHGGSTYKEGDNNRTAWEPCIANLRVQEFKDTLEFFQTKIRTHAFHYSSCSAGGNHIDLIFEDGRQAYNFAIICDTLTDCASYCKWNTMLPSEQKKFLTTNDLYYDLERKNWNLITKSPYQWRKFFNKISKLDFSDDNAVQSIEHLSKILSHITYDMVANISLLRMPETTNFYPLSAFDTVRIDDRFIEEVNVVEGSESSISLPGIRVFLLESDNIDCSLKIDNIQGSRIVSIKPGEAVHYIKKLVATKHIDLPSLFWQAEYQKYNKTFLIDECAFPYGSSLIFKSIADSEKELLLKNVVVAEQSNFAGQHIRLFFTINDTAIMVVANNLNPVEIVETTTVQEIITLSPEAKLKYENYYNSLKQSLVKNR